MNRRKRIALGISTVLALGVMSCEVASSEEPVAASEPPPATQPTQAAKPTPASKPAPDEKKPTPASPSDVSATAEPKRSAEGGKAAQRLGLDLTSDAPLQVDARSAEMLEDGKGGESLRFRGEVKLTQGELKLTCDRLDAFFPEGRSQGRPQKVVAVGDVEVVKGEFELRCTRATFEDASCILVCLSSETCQSTKWPAEPARFKRGKDWIEGRELEFNQCTGKMFARCGARLSVAPKENKPEPATEKKPAKTEAVEPEPATPAVTPP